MKQAIILFSLTFSLFSANIQAGIPVFDYAGWGLKGVSLFNQIKSYIETKNRIEKEVEALKKMAKTIKKFSNTDSFKIQDMINQINSFRARARSISYTYNDISDQFEKFYGSNGSYKKNYKAWEKQSDDSIRQAMVSQGLLERSKSHMSDLDVIVKAKRDDKSQEATLQAIGEINAIQSKQLADLSEMIATDARAKQSIVMEERAKQKNLQNYENHLMKDFNKHGKSRPLAYFPSLGTTAPRR
jgi:P-type conjugative transfer protein TrbJ